MANTKSASHVPVTEMFRTDECMHIAADTLGDLVVGEFESS